MSRNKPATAPHQPSAKPSRIDVLAKGRARRFPVSPGICLALAGQTFRYSVRRKVLLVLALFAAVVVVSYWVSPAQFPEKRVELVIRSSVMASAFFGVIVIVFLASTAIPDDISKRTIYSLLTKPVGRLNYLLGRALGFSAVAFVLLVVMGLISLVVIRYAAWEAQGYILDARRHARPVSVSLLAGPVAKPQAAPVDEETGNLILTGDWSRALVYDFSGAQMRRRHGEAVSISFEVDVETGARLPKCQVQVVARNPVSGKSGEVRATIDSMRRSVVTFGPEVVDPVKGTQIQLSRLTPGVLFMGPDALTVELAPIPFEFAFAKALLITFFGLVALIVIGLAASVFVSKWLAVVFTFSAYLIGVFSEVIRDMMVKLSSGGPQGLLGTGLGALQGQGSHAGHAHGGEVLSSPLWVTVVNKIYLVLFKAVSGGFDPDFGWFKFHVPGIIPDFRAFSGGKLVAGSYDVPVYVDIPYYEWLTALEYAAVYILVYLAVAQLVWHRREVGS